MGYKQVVQVRFLLGPAGSGKTHRCLAAIRSALAADPDGTPLVLVAPKQATFQLERQLLGDPVLAGFTRLHILSFERLAAFVLEACRQPEPVWLSEEGRVMVLRALLARHRDELRVFRAAARLSGFAQQLSVVLREIQEHRLRPDQLAALAARMQTGGRLDDKLRDLALLLRAYQQWLADHRLQDASGALDLAATTLGRRARPSGGAGEPMIGGLWLDGFAEMTPQERELVAALVPHCARAELAFCLDDPLETGERRLGTWSVVGRTFNRLQERLRSQPEIDVQVEELPRGGSRSRFSAAPQLDHLERSWARPTAFAEEAMTESPEDEGTADAAIRMIQCSTPEEEAEAAARIIRKFVRSRGARYREVGVLLRSLETHHDVLRRVFARREIPCFLDRRESVAHHPLAELTRHALRLVALDWSHDDWFGTLKTGLVDDDGTGIDLLENEALARGWSGRRWFEPLPEGTATRLEGLRRRSVAPFETWNERLKALGWRPTGTQLGAALRELWQALDVSRTLERWSESSAGQATGDLSGRAHLTVWEQINELVDNLERAFAHDAQAVVDWLPVLEAGLGSLTIGVVPPALDQVLIGAVDRSRNPDLRLVLVMGLNEGVFPAVPPPAVVLTDSDREVLTELGVELGPDRWRRMGRERYYGYIAFTRARERLILTFATREANDKALNPSPLIGH
ncbi:MAG: PD-(D/E)XK nuclease family protein, partial [Limisphaerales bacterium]